MSVALRSTPDCVGIDPHFVGDPVDTLTGAVFDAKLEFRLTGPLELWWWRHYDSSRKDLLSSLGRGHAHDFDRVLRFDADGIRYDGPLGRTVGFLPLRQVGDRDTSQGFALRRVTASRYHLSHHGQPTMEFELPEGRTSARISRLFRDRHAIHFEYDAQRGWTGIVDSMGRRVRVVEERGLLRSLTLEDPDTGSGRLLVAYEYDERGNLVRTRNAAGKGYAFAYDEANRLVRRTGRMGMTFSFDYDASGRCVKASGADRLYEVALDYEIPGSVTKVTRADGGVWAYFFDDAGGLVQILDPLGGVRRFVRDEAGRVIAEVDPNGNATSVVYDAAGAPLGKFDALGHWHALPEDPNAPDPLAHRVAANPAEYEYGRLLDLESIEVPTEARRDAMLFPSQVARLIAVRPEEAPPLSSREPPAVKPLGAMWWPEPRRGWMFNELGKLVEQRDGFGRQRRWTYDASGNIAVHTDFDGGKWTYDYGSWHFLRGLRNPNDHEVRFTYTPQGEVASFTDGGGSRSEYAYDAADRLVEVRRHGVVRERYTRDAAGNLVAKHASDGRELLRIEIGKGNLPVKKTLASGDEHTFEYDASGRINLAATGKDAVELAYDALGNCTVEKRNGRGVEIDYAGYLAPSQITWFGRIVVRYERRDDDSLVIRDPGGRMHQVRLFRHGLVERRLSNGTTELAQYDNLGRCQFKLTRRTNGPIWQRRYHWSGEGELRLVEDSARGSIRHEYDASHRLRRRHLNGRVEEFEMDAADNLLRQPGLGDVAFDQGNRLDAANGYRLTYNDRNHIETRDGPGGTTRYLYDSRDQLVRAETPHGNWEATYDSLGRRTRKIWAGKTTEYFWSGDQLGAELEFDGRLRIYVYTDPLALTPFLILEYASAEAPPEACTRYFIFGDQVAAPRLIEDERGAEVWRGEIEPFGRCVLAGPPKIDFNLRFPGHYFDAEIGLHYNRFRYFDPVLGRYVQSDPWGITGGFNLYAYRLNPLASADVRGLGDENGQGCKPNPDAESTGVPPAKQGGDYDQLGLPMTRRGEDVDQKYGTRIFTAEEREQYRVVAGPNGELVYPNQNNRPVHSPDGRAIYVMDQHGNVYVHEHPYFGDIHHSTLAAGEAPVAGGHIAQIGEPPGPAPPHLMNNSSGHYEPDGSRTELARDELARQGVDTSGMHVDDVTKREPAPAPAPAGNQAPATDPTTGPTTPLSPSADATDPTTGPTTPLRRPR